MALRTEPLFSVTIDTLLRMRSGHEFHATRQRENEIDIKPFTPAGEG